MSDLQKRIQVVCIEDVYPRKEWLRGLYLFTGLDGMSPAQLRSAKWLYTKLKEQSHSFRVLNDPDRLVHRFELLKKLYEAGVNDFNVHRVTDLPRDIRFPAFVRYERLHRANLSPLVKSRDELDDSIVSLLLRGERADELMVTEFVDYKDEDGAYRKYGAMKVGDKIVGKSFQAGHSWVMKRKHTKRGVVGSEEYEYVSDFQHREILEPIFEIGGHEWARMDYSFARGRVQVWEINDNPEQGTKWRRGFWRGRTYSVAIPNLVQAIDATTVNLEPGSPLRFEVPAQIVLGAELAHSNRLK